MCIAVLLFFNKGFFTNFSLYLPLTRCATIP
ncbi:hypothetical protein AcdelDRAFT_0723 [Acidovorax delafieldii 2AN]|uniref:Uncharacterized protein n=1 Tax=Acidovorax delafieldii 2AN TaxID=573060 RepID=C5T1E3_ACIDE|nr:hypothetical protein AcdelDRAFT_0723 [Acidovorax delafieldii 2AN]